MHFCPVGQAPQLRLLPQPSVVVPQVAPFAAQVVGLQQVLFGLQASPAAQPPQLMLVLVQLSVMTPQLFAGHVGGVHATHCPLSQFCPPGHVPQSMLLPQPSPALPHSRPRAAQVFGLQHCPALQVFPDAQLPQSRVLPQPSAAGPHV